MSINTSYYWYTDDSFIFTTKTKQVFYIGDNRPGNNEKVVRIVQNKPFWNIKKVDGLENDELELLEVEGRIKVDGFI